MPKTRSRNAPPQLVTLLVVSHAALAALLVGALAIGLVSLRRIDTLLRDLREETLGEIDEEATLHRAMWSVETAMRHGIYACDENLPEERVVEPLELALARLRAADANVGVHVAPAMRAMGARYEQLAGQSLAGPRCTVLRSAETRRDRLALDEALTDLWIERSFELHRALIEREETARIIGRRALGLGLALVFAATLTAALLARWIARSIARPLQTIATEALRVGRGDFTPLAPVEGPAEVVALGEEIDKMRHHLAELDSLKQGFLASVSHEMRTPLAKMREALALLDDGAAGALNERQSSVLRIARGACEQEIYLVTTLLDLSRLRGGNPVKYEPGRSLDAAVQEAVTQERQDAQRKKVSLELELEGPAVVRALDAVLFERAIANLLRNAVSVSPANGTVRVTRTDVASTAPAEVLRAAPTDPTHADESPSGWACVRVRDEGPGVPKEARATLFEPFATHSVDGHPSRVGVGLGLALAHEVARAHGGVLRLVDMDQTESSQGARGAVFELWFPVYEQPAVRSSRRPPARASSPPPAATQGKGEVSK